jgi:hypothetical protein
LMPDDDYYEEEAEYTNEYAPPSRTGSALLDFFAPLDPSSAQAQSFIAQVHDILGPDVFTDKEILAKLTQCNEKNDEAITALLEEKASREAVAVAEALSIKESQALPQPPPPGFGSSEKFKSPASPVPKRANPVGISLSASQAKAIGVGRPGMGTPPKVPASKGKIATNTSPLPRSKSRGTSRNSSPAIPNSGSSAKASLTSSSSSGQLNRMAPLSDDEYEFEDISSAAVARLTLVVAGHVDAVSLLTCIACLHILYDLICSDHG